MTFPLDRRTRRDEDRRQLSVDAFFSDHFPGLVERHGRLVAQGMGGLGVPDLTIAVADRTWSVRLDAETIACGHGGIEGGLRLVLSPQQFSDFAQNQVSLNGLLVARALEFHDGTLAEVSAWDSLWLTLLEGWPAVPSDLTFEDRAGAPLDLHAAFGPDADAADIAHFLRECGYVLLKGWLDPADVQQVSRDMDAAAASYHEGDGRSWWATLEDGTRVCVRQQGFVEHSPTTRRILTSPAWERLRQALEGTDKLARLPAEGRIIEALVKPLAVASGPSDLSFHRDCHLGRHAYVCSRVTVGIPITPSNLENGTLRVIAGSHRIAVPVELAKRAPPLPVIALTTEPGDLTVHLSCTLHESLAPTTSERRVLYTEIPQADAFGQAPADTSVAAIRSRMNDLSKAAQS